MVGDFGVFVLWGDVFVVEYVGVVCGGFVVGDVVGLVVVWCVVCGECVGWFGVGLFDCIV